MGSDYLHCVMIMHFGPMRERMATRYLILVDMQLLSIPLGPVCMQMEIWENNHKLHLILKN